MRYGGGAGLSAGSCEGPGPRHQDSPPAGQVGDEVRGRHREQAAVQDRLRGEDPERPCEGVQPGNHRGLRGVRGPEAGVGE